MVDPKEAMVTTRLTTKTTLMVLLISGGMRGLKSEVVLASNARLSFCHVCGNGVGVMLISVDRGGKTT